MSEWQPIDSAPKDGTEILLYGNWAGEIGGIGPRHVTLVGYWLGGRTDCPGYTWSVSGSDGYAAWLRATHWTKLPEPPK